MSKKKDEKKSDVGFWADMMRGTNGGISSKRVLGCFILVVLLIVIVVNTFVGNQNTWLGEAVMTMIIGAYSLLGIGVLEKKVNKNKIRHYGDSEEEDTPNEEDQCS